MNTYSVTLFESITRSHHCFVDATNEEAAELIARTLYDTDPERFDSTSTNNLNEFASYVKQVQA